MGCRFVIGLIGGIGSGKSRVAARFVKHGARLIQGDELAHEALRQPEIRDKIVARWGRELLDERGEIQRKKLGAIVFADPAELKALEAMVHPWVKKRIAEEIASIRANRGLYFIVLDAAVMIEAGWHDVCDFLVFVDTPLEQRLKRVAARGWTEKELRQREAAQLPLTEKAQKADHILHNSGSLDELDRQVDDLLRQWKDVPPPSKSAGRGGSLPAG